MRSRGSNSHRLSVPLKSDALTIEPPKLQTSIAQTQQYKSILTAFLSFLLFTLLWQWKRELEYESKKHCCDSVNNRKLKNAVKLGLYGWVWAIEVCSFGGSMVRASDFNGTLKRRRFEPRLRIFFTHIFFIILDCHLLSQCYLDCKWWICWTVVYSHLLLN